MAGQFQKLIGVAGSLARVVVNGIDPSEFAPVQLRSDAADFVYVGEMRSLKGIDTLISAMAIFREMSGRSPSAVLVGSGPDIDALRAKVATQGLENAVVFTGPLPAREAFTRGRIMVVPSRKESLPYVVLEAAAAQVPLVATAVGGIPEIFGPFQGRLIKPGEPGDLAEAMRRALTLDPVALASEAAALASYVQTRFLIVSMVDSITAGYHDALSQRHRGAGLLNSVVFTSQ